MATAARINSAFDTTDVRRVVRGSIVLGFVQAVCVFIVSLVNKHLVGTADHALTGIVVAIGAGESWRWHQGQVAKDQVMTAMRIAGSQLNRVQAQLKGTEQ